eukprot:3873428-Prymnesium_polylepis.1
MRADPAGVTSRVLLLAWLVGGVHETEPVQSGPGCRLPTVRRVRQMNTFMFTVRSHSFMRVAAGETTRSRNTPCLRKGTDSMVHTYHAQR